MKWNESKASSVSNSFDNLRDSVSRSSASSAFARETLASQSGNKGWVAQAQSDQATSQRLVETQFGTPVINGEKPKKAERDAEQFQPKYSGASVPAPERPVAEAPAPPKISGNRDGQMMARSAVSNEPTSASPNRDVEPMLVKAPTEPKIGGSSVPASQAALRSDESRATGPMSDVQASTREAFRLPSAKLNESADVSRAQSSERMNDVPRGGTQNDVVVASKTEQSKQSNYVLAQPKASEKTLETSSAAQNSVHSTLPSIELYDGNARSGSTINNAATISASRGSELSGFNRTEGRSRESLMSDPKVLAKNEISLGASSIGERKAPLQAQAESNRTPEATSRAELPNKADISNKLEVAELNRQPCARSTARQDEGQLSGMNEYFTSARKPAPIESALTNRQSGLSQGEGSIVMENSRNTGIRNTESGANTLTSGRGKQDGNVETSIKNGDERSDKVGTGAKSVSEAASRESGRPAQKDVEPTSGRTNRQSDGELVRGNRTPSSSYTGGGGGGGSRAIGDGKGRNTDTTDASNRGDKIGKNLIGPRPADNCVSETKSGSARKAEMQTLSDGVSSTAKRGVRVEPANGAEVTRKGFNNNGSIAQIIETDKRNGLVRLNSSKRDEQAVSSDKNCGVKNIATGIASAVRLFDLSGVGRWIASNASKVRASLDASVKREDGSKVSEQNAAKEFYVHQSGRIAKQQPAQLFDVKPFALKIGSTSEPGSEVNAPKDTVKTISRFFVEGNVLSNSLRPSDALKQFLAKVEAEELKMGVKPASSRINVGDLNIRQMECRRELSAAYTDSGKPEFVKDLRLGSSPELVLSEVVRDSSKKRVASQEPWELDFTVPVKPEISNKNDDELVTFTTDTVTVAVSCIRQKQAGTTTVQIKQRAQYCVQGGDTLRSIAIALFADARVAQLISELNRESLPSGFTAALQAGTVLWLPTQAEINTFNWSRQAAAV